jgi:hypothetical protein
VVPFERALRVARRAVLVSGTGILGVLAGEDAPTRAVGRAEAKASRTAVGIRSTLRENTLAGRVATDAQAIGGAVGVRLTPGVTTASTRSQGAVSLGLGGAIRIATAKAYLRAGIGPAPDARAGRRARHGRSALFDVAAVERESVVAVGADDESGRRIVDSAEVILRLIALEVLDLRFGVAAVLWTRCRWRGLVAAAAAAECDETLCQQRGDGGLRRIFEE